MTAKVIALPGAAQRVDSSESGSFAPRSQFERGLGLVATLRAGEGRSVLLFFSYAFALLVCYYVLKLLREPLLLVGGSAENKSYAQGTIALVLMVLVPLYCALFRRMAPARLVRVVTGVFAASLGVFYVLGSAGVDVGFAYYVWVGVFGVTMLAQFWAHAAHSFDVASGQRLFPVVMAGATFGGLVAPPLVGALFPVLGAWNLMLLALVLLAATLPLVGATRRAVPLQSRNRSVDSSPAESQRSGFGLVARDRYLMLLAALIVLLNCVNTTGEYLLTDFVLRHAHTAVAGASGLDEGAVIAAFYSDYYLAVNALAAVLQLFVVGRVFRWFGVHGAILVLPTLALIGYGLLVFVPVFALVRLVKIVENSVDYSIMNTTRHALYLPLPVDQQYRGKTTIDGFFWRVGDVIQAGVIYVGLNWLVFEPRQFALLNLALALGWLAIALRVGAHYRRRAIQAPRVAPRRARSRVVATAVGLAAVVSAANAVAENDAAAGLEHIATPVAAIADVEPLFGTDSPLELEILFDESAFCRNPQRESCADTPATLLYRSEGGTHSLAVTLRARGRWRKDTADCRLPALFVFFGDAAGTPFEGQKMLPLTTHCRAGTRTYEQYVLKEYLAYRILNLLTDSSLRVRLARITYRDPGEPEHAVSHNAFFTEHFDSFAARHGAEVWRPEALDLQTVDANALATSALFEFMIGNTDWSAIHGHNVVAIRDAAGAVGAVPFDFDFSGFVDAEYAGPPPGLPIQTVRQRLFRGVCTPQPDWGAVFAAFDARRADILALIADFPGLDAGHRARALAYVESFYAIIASPERRTDAIVAACRRAV